MINDKIEKGAIIAAVVLAVGGGAYFAGAKALGACDTKAKAKNTAMTSNGATTCEKIHASAMASKNGADAKARNAAMTETDAKADDCCESKATTAAMASSTCGDKATTAAMASKNGSCDAKATNAVMTTGADACPHLKSQKAQATRAAAVSAKEDCPPEACEASGSGACPMEKGAKGSPSKKVENKKAAPKGTMASVVPAETTAK